MRVLIVEDEAVAAGYLQRGLRNFGHVVDIAPSGEAALEKIGRAVYDLVLLDLGLQGKSGFQVCRDLRAGGQTLSILMLTARDGVEDRVLGLDCGADDYLVKPYQLRELLARMRALERRSSIRHLGVLQLDTLSLDIKGRRVTRADKTIDLTAKELAVLEYLLNHAGQVVSRQDLLTQVWGEQNLPASNTIEVYIQRLRKKIDHGHAVPLIHTQHGLGYLLTVKREDGRV